MEDEEARKETMATSLESSGKITCFVVASCVMAAMGGFLFGYDIGVSGGVMSMSPFLERFFPKVYNLEEEDKTRRQNNTNNNHYCLFNSQLLTTFTSSLYVSGFVATLLASYVTRSWGRKPSIFIGGVAFLVGSFLGGAAQNVAMLIIARLLLGVGVGFANQSVPLYLSEMSLPKHRGAISNGFQLCIGIGFLTANIINYETQKIKDGYGWRISLATGAIPALILTFGSLFLPETPNCIVQISGDVKKAEIVLRRIRGREDVGYELRGIVEAVSNANADPIGGRNAIATGRGRGTPNAIGSKHVNAIAILSKNANAISVGSANALVFGNANAIRSIDTSEDATRSRDANVIRSINANAIGGQNANAIGGQNAIRNTNAIAIGSSNANTNTMGSTIANANGNANATESSNANANAIGDTDANADEKGNALLSRNAKVNANAHQAFMKLLERRYRPELVMALAIPFFQQVTGINVVAFYAPVLFRTVGFGESGSLMSTLVIGIVGTASTLLSMLLVDKIGRKTLFLIGGLQMLASQVTLGAIIMTADGGGERQGYAVVVLVCVYVAGFGWSWGPLGWLVPSEIFPLEIRSAAQSLTVAVSFFFTFAVAQSVPPMLCKFGAGLFFFYGGWVVVMTVAAQMFLPETKNVHIEKVCELWEKHWFWKRIAKKLDTQETTILRFS